MKSTIFGHSAVGEAEAFPFGGVIGWVDVGGVEVFEKELFGLGVGPLVKAPRASRTSRFKLRTFSHRRMYRHGCTIRLPHRCIPTKGYEINSPYKPQPAHSGSTQAFSERRSALAAVC
jgi:hypothetical protein